MEDNIHILHSILDGADSVSKDMNGAIERKYIDEYMRDELRVINGVNINYDYLPESHTILFETGIKTIPYKPVICRDECIDTHSYSEPKLGMQIDNINHYEVISPSLYTLGVKKEDIHFKFQSHIPYMRYEYTNEQLPKDQSTMICKDASNISNIDNLEVIYTSWETLDSLKYVLPNTHFDKIGLFGEYSLDQFINIKDLNTGELCIINEDLATLVDEFDNSSKKIFINSNSSNTAILNRNFHNPDKVPDFLHKIKKNNPELHRINILTTIVKSSRDYINKWVFIDL